MPEQNKKSAYEKNLNEQQKEQMKELKKATKSYAGKSEAELLKELSDRVNQGKEKGTITAKQLENFEKKVAPMLDEEQRKKLKKLLETMNKK